jgi:Tfp pilus assembly protein PilO
MDGRVNREGSIMSLEGGVRIYLMIPRKADSHTMKKNIIIALLSVLLILSIVFGYYQKTEADKFEAQAIENEKMAREAAVNAEKQMMLAQEHAQMTLRAVDELQVALEELKKSKKSK